MSEKLKSRKFLLAVVAFLGFLATKQYTEATAVVLAYLGVQGAIDHKGS